MRLLGDSEGYATGVAAYSLPSSTVHFFSGSSIAVASTATTADIEITPETKVAALLEAYPELEDVLIKLAPPFKKLKNPLLRRSVARVASLRQAASVARLPVEEVVNHIRAAAGQSPLSVEERSQHEYIQESPSWFDASMISASITEGQDGDPNKMTITTLLPLANKLGLDEVLELISSFVPAPGIDILRNKGFEAWSVQSEGEEIRTYVARPRGG